MPCENFIKWDKRTAQIFFSKWKIQKNRILSTESFPLKKQPAQSLEQLGHALCKEKLCEDISMKISKR
jgi:hypothetical protein